MGLRIVIIAVVSTAAISSAGIVPRLNEDSVRIPELVNKSSLICKGEVTSAPSLKSVDGPLPRMTGIATIRVDRCFKGRFENQILVAADEYYPAGGLSGGGHLFAAKVGEYLLVFLKEHGAIHELADENRGALPVSRRTSSLEQTGNPRADLENDFEAGLSDADQEMVLKSICWLGRLQHLRSTRALHALLPHTDALTRTYVWESLLLVGDLSVIGEVAKSLQEDPPVRHGFFLPADHLPYMRQRLYFAFCGLREPAVIPYLEHFADFSNARIRVEAIQALRSIGSLRSAPVFLRALDDHREDIDFIAMQSLFELAGEGPSDFGPAYANSAPHPHIQPAKCRQWWKEIGEAKARARARDEALVIGK